MSQMASLLTPIQYSRARKMAQQVNVFATKPHGLNLILWTQKAEEKNQFWQVVI